MPNGDVGAALVFMDVELALPPRRSRRCAANWPRRSRPARPQDARPSRRRRSCSSKPQVTKANVTVEVLAGSGNLVQKVNHAGKPSMYGNNVVAMSAELNQLGAPVFEAVMKSEGAGRRSGRLRHRVRRAAAAGKAAGTWIASKFYSFFQEVDFEENFWSEDDLTEQISEIFSNSESRLVEVDPGALDTHDPGSRQDARHHAELGRAPARRGGQAQPARRHPAGEPRRLEDPRARTSRTSSGASP